MAIWKVFKPETASENTRTALTVHGWNNTNSVVAIIEMDADNMSDEEILDKCAKLGLVNAPDTDKYVVRRDIIKTSWNDTESQISVAEKANMYIVGHFKCLDK